jgi:type II secretory pathway component PulK
MDTATLVLAIPATLAATPGAATAVRGGITKIRSLLEQVVKNGAGQVEQSYAQLEQTFRRAYRSVMGDLDDNGKCKAINAQRFTEAVGNVCYLHARNEDEAWQWYREVQAAA